MFLCLKPQWIFLVHGNFQKDLRHQTQILESFRLRVHPPCQPQWEYFDSFILILKNQSKIGESTRRINSRFCAPFSRPGAPFFFWKNHEKTWGRYNLPTPWPSPFSCPSQIGRSGQEFEVFASRRGAPSPDGINPWKVYAWPERWDLGAFSGRSNNYFGEIHGWGHT